MKITCLSCSKTHLRSVTKRSEMSRYCPIVRRDVDASSEPCNRHPMMSHTGNQITSKTEVHLL